MTFYGDGACVVRLSGPEYGALDAEKLAAVRDLLLELASLRQVSCLVLDLSNVQFLGAAFAGTLVETWQQLRKRSRFDTIADGALFSAWERRLHVAKKDAAATTSFKDRMECSPTAEFS
jgi:anti-anti-sigma factor